MERGISLVTDNEILVDKVRCQVEQDFNKEIDPSPESPHKIYRQLVADSIETPVYTFTLPDITRYPGRKFQKIQIHIFFLNMKITASRNSFSATSLQNSDWCFGLKGEQFFD